MVTVAVTVAVNSCAALARVRNRPRLCQLSTSMLRASPGDAARGANEVSRNVQQAAQGANEVSKNVQEAVKGVTDIARNVNQLAGGVTDVARNAAEAEAESWGQTEAAQRASAQELVAAAKHKAALETQARLADATTRIEAQISSAEHRILAARQAALAEFEQVAADVAQDITQRVAGLVVSADDARSAVKGPFAHG